jgi:ribonuclease HII
VQWSFPYSDSSSAVVAGVDEAGRGPLAGAVLAAAVILDPKKPIVGLNDSKQLTCKQRQRAYELITQTALCYALGRASVAEIDGINILQASLLAMSRAVQALQLQPEFIYVDGLHCPSWAYSSRAVVKGDSKLDCVAAASVLAKVSRDQEMIEFDKLYPGYGFAIHKGYPTKVHLDALARFGPCPIHRSSFRPVRDCIKDSAVPISAC